MIPLVQLVDDPDPFQGEARVDDVDHPGLLRDHLRHSSGGNDLGLSTQLLFETLNQLFHQAHIAENRHEASEFEIPVKSVSRGFRGSRIHDRY